MMGSCMNSTRLQSLLTIALVAGLSACSGGNAHMQAGFKALQQGDYSRAEPELKQALADDPSDPFSKLNLGAVYQNTGRADQAVPLYRDVLVSGKDIYPKRTSGAATPRQSLAEIAQDNLSKIPASR